MTTRAPMTTEELKAWAAIVNPHDDRHWCGVEITFADVKRAVSSLLAEREAHRERIRALEVPRDRCVQCLQLLRNDVAGMVMTRVGLFCSGACLANFEAR